MTTLNITTEPLKRLPDITEVEPFNEKDKPVVDEIIQVLKKYNALDRFGLTLLHQRFDVPDDEVMIETTDIEAKSQTIQPMKIKDVDPSNTIETSWRLDTGKPVMGCICLKINGHGHYPRPSDRLLKNNVEKINHGLEEILKLQPVTYFYKNDLSMPLPTERQLGFIAQEVQNIIPEIVKDKSEFKAIDYVSLIPVLVKAIQEQQGTIEKLQQEINVLKTEQTLA